MMPLPVHTSPYICKSQPKTEAWLSEKTDGFAWASVPVSFTWVRGNKYIYTLDFTNGAGKVDPVDPGTDWKKDEPQKDPDKGQDILGEPIKFTVTVNPWTPENKNQEM